MSKFFWLSPANRKKHVNDKKGVPQKFRLTQSRVNLLLFIAILVLGAAYLVQVNRTATSGFAVEDLDSEIGQLQESHRKLELQVAELQSLQRIKAASDRLDLVATTAPIYLQASAGVVAIEK
ncbi:MAG: hypothetical protein Q8Q20_00465 [bacterium]|nr:hypothetical protein [bacterium]